MKKQTNFLLILFILAIINLVGIPNVKCMEAEFNQISTKEQTEQSEREDFLLLEEKMLQEVAILNKFLKNTYDILDKIDGASPFDETWYLCKIAESGINNANEAIRSANQALAYIIQYEQLAQHLRLPSAARYYENKANKAINHAIHLRKYIRRLAQQIKVRKQHGKLRRVNSMDEFPKC